MDGEGEWKVRTHGASKRRTWRRLHVAVNKATQQILLACLTTHEFKDCEILEELMAPIDHRRIEQVTGDGAYDAKNCYEWGKRRGIKVVFPPKKGSRIKNHGNLGFDPLQRDQHIRKIRKHGKTGWKVQENYHRRSIAKTAIHRTKRCFGGGLRSRLFENQAVEVAININLLNRWKIPTTCS